MKYFKYLVYLLLFGHCLCVDVLLADTTDSSDNSNSIYESLMGNVDQQHLHLSRKVVKLASGVDSYFSGNTIAETENRSYVKLRLESFFEKGGINEVKLRIKGKLDLPNTQKKIHVFFDNRAESSPDLFTQAFQNNSGRETDSEVGVGYEKGRKRWKYTTSVGLKPRLPFNPVFKFSVGRDFDTGDIWQTRFDQKVWYYHDKGWGEESSLLFERPMANDYVFRVFNELQFQDRYDAFEWGEIFSLYKQLNEKSSVQYSLGGFANSRPEWKSSRYFIMLEYRKDVHNGWLFMNVSPLLGFERQGSSFKAKPSLVINLVAVFSDF